MTNAKRRTPVLALAVATALLALGCGGGEDGTGPAAPQPGQLTVNVTTSGAAGAAFLLTVRGPGITSPTPGASGQKLYTFASGDTLRAAVIGTVTAGALLKFSVPDVNQASSYRATLNEVAGTDNALLATSSFSVTVTQ
jgi:hypothetical protein